MSLKPDLKRLILPRIHAGIVPLPDRSTLHQRQAIQFEVTAIIRQVLDEQAIELSEAEFEVLLEMMMFESIGLGALETLLDDAHITEITVIGPTQIFMTVRGERRRVECEFDDEAHLLHTINRLLASFGQHVDARNPAASVLRADGSQVEVMVPPLAYQPTLHIFKNSRAVWTDTVRVCDGMITSAAMEFLKYAVLAQLNIALVGAQSLRKTTLLNALIDHIPAKARLVLIEDYPALKPPHAQVIGLRSSRAAAAPQLMRQIQVLRPDYCIAAGKSGELLAGLISHDVPYLLDFPSGDSEQVVGQMLQTCQADASDVPPSAVLARLAQSIDLMVALEWRAGTRQVTSIGELNADGILAPVWAWQDSGLRVTGHRPRCMNRLRNAGLNVPPALAPQYTNRPQLPS